MWTDADLYDLENADDPAFDLAFWESVVRELAPRRMLELACGTGRLTLPLARLGVVEELVALDSSAPFLERLRSRLSDEPITVVEGDMRAPPVDGPFDLIVVPFNSLAYLTSRESRVACLRGVRSLLAPGGRFAFDLVAPRYDFLAEGVGACPPLRVDADHPAPENGVARFLRSYTDTYDRGVADAALHQPLRDLLRGRPRRAPDHRPRLAHLLPRGALAAPRRVRARGGRALRRLRPQPMERSLQALSLVGCGA